MVSTQKAYVFLLVFYKYVHVGSCGAGREGSALYYPESAFSGLNSTYLTNAYKYVYVTVLSRCSHLFILRYFILTEFYSFTMHLLYQTQ